jgi:hypothetical protein
MLHQQQKHLADGSAVASDLTATCTVKLKYHMWQRIICFGH